MQLPISPGSPIVLPIRIYGERGVREMDALLDTGAAFVTVSPAHARQLGYDWQNAPHVPIVTANGVIRAPRIILSRVSVGEFAEANVEALCLDLPGAGVSSLLGLSFLSRLNVALDAKSQTLLINDP